MSNIEALMVCNPAPLFTHRDISMFGVIYRVVLGRSPCQFQEFFVFALVGEAPTGNLHRLQIKEHCGGSEDLWREVAWLSSPITAVPEYIKRSALGFCTVHNMLPACVGETVSNVALFHGNLQKFVKAAYEGCYNQWELLLSSRLQAPAAKLPMMRSCVVPNVGTWITY